MSWDKLPALTTQEAGLRSGCLTCGPQPVTLAMDAGIFVYGSAGISKDGVAVWEFDMNAEDDDDKTAQDAEDMALADPDHDWRVYFVGPLSESEYQRHAAGEWVLVKKGDGFA